MDDLRCKECGQIFINLVDYASCPDGHGRLQPKIDDRELALIVASQIPHIRTGDKRGDYYLNGRRVRAVARFGLMAAVKRFREGQQVARCDRFRKGFGTFEYLEKAGVKS